MGGIFWSSEPAPPPPSKRRQEKLSETDKAKLDLKRNRDKLKKYSNKLQEKIDRETALAKDLLKKDKVRHKNRVLLILRRKKLSTKSLNNAEKNLMNVETLLNDLQDASLTQEVIASIKIGTDALKEINSMCKLEDIDQLMEDTQEAMAYQQEVSEALGQDLTDVDDEECLAELEEWQAEQDAMAALDLKNALGPDVTATISVEEQKETEAPKVNNNKKVAMALS